MHAAPAAIIHTLFFNFSLIFVIHAIGSIHTIRILRGHTLHITVDQRFQEALQVRRVLRRHVRRSSHREAVEWHIHVIEVGLVRAGSR